VIADQVEHIRDLKIAQALHQARKHEHADDDQDPDDPRRERRDHPISATVNPGERREGENERRRKRAERVKERTVTGQPKHEAQRVRDGAELHHDEAHSEYDARQRHHAGGRGREIGLGRRSGQLKQLELSVRPPRIFGPRQGNTADYGSDHVEHRNEPRLQCRSTPV
jgi:hypothetical protein